MKDDLQHFLRAIPSMDELLSLPWVEQLEIEMGREAVKSMFGEVLTDVRRVARDGGADLSSPPMDLICERARRLMNRRASASLTRVVNATGVVVHTNLGRSPLPDAALEAVANAAAGYSTLEYSLEDGMRGHRNAHVEWLVKQLTGAQAALVVNNNAGAVLLTLAATARGREVIVSAGELVEIGGSFRIPDILAFSGAKMVAVGCTNCTHLRDYRDAITEETSVILKVHPSNYRIEGFTESVSREDLASLARERGLVFMEDLGSGLLEQLNVRDLGSEPTVRDCIEAGVDIVTFSGDKLLGGPQMGCVAGSADLIASMRGNQLLRALRVDKMTLAAFEVILRMYLKGRSGDIPTVAMLRADPETLRERAEALRDAIRGVLDKKSIATVEVELTSTDDAVGGGSYPTSRLPGCGVSLSMSGGVSAEKFAARLRECRVPVVPGIRDGKIVFHVRTLLKGDIERISDAMEQIF